MDTNYVHVVGDTVQRRGARDRVLGKPCYAADIIREGALTLLAVRGDRPHARIKKIHSSQASAIKGCVKVFTHKDIPGRNRFGIISKDQPLLAEDKIRFVGDAVALVAAETIEAACAALAVIRVDYEDLQAVLDPEEALRPGAPQVHQSGNVLGRRVVKRGNPDEAFKRADVVVERLYVTKHVEHAYLEPDAGLAYVDENGMLVVFASTQNPHYDQKDLADLLGVDKGQVRVIQAATGGGFGSKLDLNVQGFVALAAFLLKRPARMVYSREEAFLCTPKRHPLRIQYKTGATKDGRLLAVDVRILGDTGAYASYGMAVVTRSAVHATGPYEIPNVHIESIFAYTNNPISGAMRGFGVPQVAFAHESQMDLVAAELGMNPLEFRRRNALRIGSHTCTMQELKVGVGIGATLDAVTPHYEKARILQVDLPWHKRRGIGVASMMYGIGNTGVQNPSTAQLELGRDGTVTLFSGAADIGQGSSTVLVQIAAQEMGLKVEDIRLVAADTMLTTSAGATSASRQTYISGNAVLDAAAKLKEVLLTEAATVLKYAKQDLVLVGGQVRSRSKPAVSVSLQELAQRASRVGLPLKWQGYFDPPTTPLNPETGEGTPYATFAYATHVAVIEIDILTGEIEVVNVVAAHDVGRAINPGSVLGQIYSGVAMGIGFALMEEFDPGKTGSLKDYHIPCCKDVPEITAIIVEEAEPTGPYGAKGVGEPALIPTAPAISNAIADALGVRILELPAGLESVMKAALVSIPREN